LIGHLASSSALEKCHLENQVVDGRIILKWILYKLDYGNVNLVERDDSTVRLWPFVNVVTNFMVS
jgi:hypothetical protein